jgi:hypothetical protein
MRTEESEFDRVAEALGLLPDEYLGSSALRQWARKNKDYKSKMNTEISCFRNS